jgi:hypothetical protein
MEEVYQAPEYGDKGSGLGCSASEVSAVATGVEGPSTCSFGSTVKVNVTAALTFNTDRYDIGLYTYTGSPDDYNIHQEQSAVKGSKCAFQILDECEAGGNNTDNGVYDIDGDSCCDVVAQSGYTYEGFRFQDNLEVPCVTGYGTSLLALNTCFSWRQS